jgi:hypothetical protein
MTNGAEGTPITMKSMEFSQEGKLSEEGEASRPSPTASFKKRTTPLPLLQLANLVARNTILASLFWRIHTPDTVDRPINESILK